MTKEELLKALAACAAGNDAEKDHLKADSLLLTYINDPEISEAFTAVERWYA